MPEPISYQPLERLTVPRPVSRLPFLAERCRGKRVLDLGALDETAIGSKRGQGTWLHEALAATASEVLGIDNSDTIPANGLVTAPNARIMRGNVMTLGPALVNHFRPEVIVAGELIEHLPNPLQFLQSLRNAEHLRHCEILLTTPNATAVHNVLIGLAGCESTHCDHLCILSYKTLHTLCLRAGFKHFTIIPYYASFPEMRARNRGLLRLLIATGERFINGVEWLFPLLSFGYIVRIHP